MAVLVTLYKAQSPGRSWNPPLEREILLVVAVAYDEKLNQSEKAVEFFRMAQEIEPEDASALEALERLYTRTERWPDLVETLKKKADLVQSVGSARPSTLASPPSLKKPSATPRKPSPHGRKSSATIPAALWRCAPSIACLAGHGRGPGRQSATPARWPWNTEQQVLLLWRLGQLREQQLGEVAAAIETYSPL